MTTAAPARVPSRPRNRYETQARTVKACRLVDTCLTRGIDYPAARALSDRSRRMIERATFGEKAAPASDDTWTMVHVMLKHYQDAGRGPVPLFL